MADITTKDVITAVRAKLSDSAFDQLLIIDALNFFIADLYHNTRTRRMETNDQLFPGAGDTTADLSDDTDSIIRLTVTSPNVYDLSDNYMEYGDFMRMFPKWQTDSAKALQQWTDFANALRFSAPLLTNTTIDIDYMRTPVLSTLTSSTPSDSIELDEGYKELATLGTLARCMESNEDYAEAESERQNLAPLVTAWTRNEGRGGIKTGPVIMRSNRRSTRTSRNRDW